MARLSQLFTPRERGFYDLFEEAGANLQKAAGLLDKMLGQWPDGKELMREVLECEHEGDRITHEIVERLNVTFVTPIDREDILELASGMDDILDFIEEVADFMGLYRIEAPMEQAIEAAGILKEACKLIHDALPRLRENGDVSGYVEQIHRLEHDGDRISRAALASLFERGIDPMMVIRWKDIFERLEEAIDATEKVANVLRGITIKNS